jgi:hypothetical protein
MEVEVDVGDAHAGSARRSLVSPNRRRIARSRLVLEALALAAMQQLLAVGVGDHGEGLVGDDRRADMDHRVAVQVTLVHRPAAQDLQDLVLDGGAGRAGSEQVDHERLEVGLAGFQEPDPAPLSRSLESRDSGIEVSGLS